MEDPINPIDNKTAAYLAQEVIRQFQEMPLAVNRIPLNEERLALSLMQATGFEHKKRMQFIIPENNAHRFIEENPINHLIVSTFCPIRVLANYDTGYTPTRAERAAQSIEELIWERRGIKFMPETIFRRMRTDNDISKIRQRSLKAGNRYGIGVYFTTSLNFKDEYHGGDHEYHIPLVFIPGATKEELDVLARFSIKEQNPRHEIYEHALKEQAFEERLYAKK